MTQPQVVRGVPRQQTPTRAPISLLQAEGMLSFVDGGEDRETWLNCGMAMKAEFGDAGFDAWDRWSQAATNYSAPACRASWRGFKVRAGGVTIGTLIHLAKRGGYTFSADDRPAVDPAELARRRAARDARAQAETAARLQQAAQAEDTALATWRNAQRDGVSVYAQRKGIERPESVRYLLPRGDEPGGLVVPMLRYDLPRDQALKGVQIIRDDGGKKFTFGMEKAGTACRLGLPVVGAPIWVCEGWATGMTLRMALASIGHQHPVFVAFDAYNLPLVAEAVYRAHPQSPMLIAADDDHKTVQRGAPANTGRIQAQVAHDAVLDAGARLVARTFPIFAAGTERGAKDTDFNDLHRLEGLFEVAQQLFMALETHESLKQHG